MSEEKTTVQEPIKVIHGKVSNCNYLNIRKEPHKSSEIETIIEKDQVVEICPSDESLNKLWCKVKLENGVSGFCMSKYITKTF